MDVPRAEVILNIAFRHQPSATESDLLTLRLNAFVAAAQLGMFCGSSFSPDQSNLVMEHRPVSDSVVLSRHLRFVNVDMGAFRILRNMLLHYSHWSARLDKAEARLLSSPSENMFDKTFTLPGVYMAPGFPIVKHAPGRRDKWRLVHIKLGQRLEPMAMDATLEDLSSWELICGGGFAEDQNHPEHSGIMPGDLYFISPRTIEYSIEGFYVAEDALNALLNFAVAVDRKRCRISQVEIW